MFTFKKVAKGAAFKRDKKGENSPDFSGPIEVEEPISPGDYMLSIWKSTSRDKGIKYLSVSVTLKLDDDGNALPKAN